MKHLSVNHYILSCTLTVALLLSSLPMSAQYYMDIVHNSGNRTQFAVSTIDSIRITDSYGGTQNTSQSSDSLSGTGLYLGVMGFNQQLYTHPINLLNSNTRVTFDSFIENLQLKNGTILCYSVEQAIEALRSYPIPDNLSSVAIVTFTDGLDQGSLMMSNQYDTDDEYLASLNATIRNEKIGGVPLIAYSIGLRGSDVTTSDDIAKFRTTIKKLASSNSYATEVSNMSAVKTRFQEIAKQLNTNLQNVEIRIPGLSNGTRVRFTFDNVTTASLSNKYIEGTFDLTNRTLTDVRYQGMNSTSGVTVSGYAEDIYVSFRFDSIHTNDNMVLSKSNIKEWYRTTSSSWQINSEFAPDWQPDIQTIRSSAVIMLVLDCSSSLGDKFTDVKTNAKSFINTLYNSYDDPTGNNGETTYEYVDLGLSVNWATCNVGADAPEEYGDYYAWGETKTKNTYNWSTYKYCNGSSSTITKYCNQSDNGLNGFKDNKTTLDPEDDVANVKWGGNWHIPTRAELKELYDNCKWTFTSMNGVDGYKVTSKLSGYTDCSIFLPTAGWRTNESVENIGYGGLYWSKTLCTSNQAWYLNLNSKNNYITVIYGNYSSRELGLSVRPVCKSETWKGISAVLLDTASVEIVLNEKETLKATVKNGSDIVRYPVEWSSNNNSVATVNNNGEVTAISEGVAIITAKCYDQYASCTISVKGYEYVDLGLSVKWATCNVGAKTPEDYGDYYAWGETYKKNSYSWSKYTYCNGNSNTLIKYNTIEKRGIVDNKTIIEPEDDVAYVKWGGHWRIPTNTEFEELIDNCTWKWTTQNGVKGYKVTSNIPGYTDRFIFLPAAGYRYDTNLNYTETYGQYWSNTVYSDDPSCAWYLFFNSETHVSKYRSGGRNDGFSVRPVCL